MPPIQCHKFGTLFTCEMLIGTILFLLNLVMQLGLTYVVGQQVVHDSNQWRLSLLAETDVFHTPSYSEPTSFSVFGPGKNKFESWDHQDLVDNELPDTWDPMGHLVSEAEEDLGLDKKIASQTALLQNDRRFHRTSKPHQRHHPHHVYKLDVSPPKDDLVFHLRHKNSRPMHHPVGKQKGKNLAGPLCYPYPAPEKAGDQKKTFSCLPWSALYAREWKKLDANNDGIWSHEEALKDEGLMKKLSGVKPTLVYFAITHGLADRRKRWDTNIT